MYDLMQNEVFPFIKNLHAEKESAYSKYMGDAIFKLPTPQLLQKVVSSLDETTGSEERLEVALPTGPEQAEINKANKSDKCFFILLVLNS